MAARSIVSMPCASIWPDAIRLRSALSRIMLAETAEQLGLDGIERIGPLQAHDLADPFRAGQQQVKTNRWNYEQVHGGNIWGVVMQEASPSLAGWPRRLTMYLATLDCATSNPSLSSSPWMRCAPQSGFSILIRRISARSSVSTGGRPPRRRDFQRQ